jgi:ankyrin repeat protein
LDDEKRKKLLTACDNDKNTPLHLAAKYGNADVFVYLLEHARKMIDPKYDLIGPKYGLTVPRNRTDRSALHECAKHNRLSLIQALLQLPREIDRTELLDTIKDEDQMTAVHFACREGKHKSSL